MNPNNLIHESSPYLLQHAYNPVDWKAWGNEAFEKAKQEGKLIIISIGYSSCHWCHVMEKETFENQSAADIMNEHFVSVKVDREERPDIDQIYMTAVQLMTRQGGWPLNVVALPDGRPIWGGTYFPLSAWKNALQDIYGIYKDDPEKVKEYAEKLHEGIVQSELIEAQRGEAIFEREELQAAVVNWQRSFDNIHGGPDRSPKFPMPCNYEFLLHFGHMEKDEKVLDHVKLTLDKMALGGIYDQVGGGFARYSTDMEWKVPHFEKMLYDNAQLVSLYSRAYQKFKKPLYKRIVEETLEWINREMTGGNGEFFSAIDADSDGEEGKFYIWKEEELKDLISPGEWEDFQLYYNLTKGQWENDKIILLRSGNENEKSPEWNRKLLAFRNKRNKPGLDDKALTSWNSMMITALVDAHVCLSPTDDNYLQKAIKNAEWLLQHQAMNDDSLRHSYKNGKSSIEGLIEDYAFSIQAFLKLFEVTFDLKYLHQAEKWMEYAKNHFQDEETQLFYTRNLQSVQLIAKSMDTQDNVIPAANSVMAHNLFRLSHYLDNSAYRKQAEVMLYHMKDILIRYGENYSNWARLMIHLVYPFEEIALSGKNASAKAKMIGKRYLPNALIVGAEQESELPLLRDRFVAGKTLIYVCRNKTCDLPVEDVDVLWQKFNQEL